MERWQTGRERPLACASGWCQRPGRERLRCTLFSPTGNYTVGDLHRDWTLPMPRLGRHATGGEYITWIVMIQRPSAWPTWQGCTDACDTRGGRPLWPVKKCYRYLGGCFVFQVNPEEGE